MRPTVQQLRRDGEMGQASDRSVPSTSDHDRIGAVATGCLHELVGRLAGADGEAPGHSQGIEDSDALCVRDCLQGILGIFQRTFRPEGSDACHRPITPAHEDDDDHLTRSLCELTGLENSHATGIAAVSSYDDRSLHGLAWSFTILTGYAEPYFGLHRPTGLCRRLCHLTAARLSTVANHT
jgi:hypothetical protein